jgi:ribosomal protein L9
MYFHYPLTKIITMNSIPTFDTYAYYQQLKSAGFTSEQAEVQTQLQANVLSSLMTEKLATKEDITELKQDMVEFKTEIKQEMVEFKAEIKQEMVEFKAEIKQEMSGFKTEVKQDIADIKKDVFRLENKISSTDNKLSWLLGLTGTFGSLFTAIQIIPHFCHAL